MVIRKDADLVFPISWGAAKEYDIRSFSDQSWRDLVYSVIEKNGGHHDAAGCIINLEQFITLNIDCKL